METYLPYPSLEESIRTYDHLTVTAVRRSILAILESLHDMDSEKTAPSDHPELVKWRGHEPFLCQFGFLVGERELELMANIGAMPSSLADYSEKMSYHLDCASSGDFTLLPPEWWGREEIHRADQAALLRRNYGWYKNIFHHVEISMQPAWMFGFHG